MTFLGPTRRVDLVLRNGMLYLNWMYKSQLSICILVFLAVLAPSDVFAKGKTTRVSVSSTSEQGNDYSQYQSISPDGRYVAFESDADNLVAGDNNASMDIFVHDRQPESSVHNLPFIPLLLLGD
jgi:hypothetical protein